MTQEHSPLPWKVVSNKHIRPRIFDAENFAISECEGANESADAALIINAVNSHDDLVKALQNFVDACEVGGIVVVDSILQTKFEKTVETARLALAKAKAVSA